MAMILLGNSTSTDPTTCVAEALKDFQEILSSEQRLQFQANAVQPDASSVLTFMSRIDVSKGQGMRRCVVQRICTFLEAIQGIVDTFVSSNPGIAALAWGGVKTAILIASNSASYFEKVTAIIMNAGRSCPSYKQFGLLYPSSIDLQIALNEYFAAVIRLCTKTVQVSQRSAFIQVVRPMMYPFEAEFSTNLLELDHLAKEINIQIALASSQVASEDSHLLKADSEANARHRMSMTRFRRELRDNSARIREMRLHAKDRHIKRLKADVKENLSSLDHDHSKAWKRALQQCTPGTAIWFQHISAFSEWIKDRKTSILRCSGNLGTGKTILTSSVVKYLYSKKSDRDVISYFFCQAELSTSLLARNILGSIARQLLNSYIDRASDNELEDLYAQTRNLDEEGIVRFLVSKLEDGFTYFVVLDGLDQCEDDALNIMSQSLDILYAASNGTLKIFYTTRPDIRPLFTRSLGTYRMSLASPE